MTEKCTECCGTGVHGVTHQVNCEVCDGHGLVEKKKPAHAKRYFLAQDNSSHWYIVDAAKRSDWDKWIAIPEHEPASWDTPEFAIALGRGPSFVEFSNPTGHD